MNKPTKKTTTYWDYNEVSSYIEKKYKIKFRDYAGKFKTKTPNDIPYQDFWHWIIDRHDYISNGSMFYLCIADELTYSENTPEFATTILKLIQKEFNEDVMEFWVEW